jgi:hypothetical protein
VNLLFNQNQPPTGTNAGDYTLLSNSMAGVGSPILQLSSAPRLVPGARYFLGVQNPNNSNVVAAVQVDFDITPLFNRVPCDVTMQANLLPRYFSYDVSTNATAVSFRLFNLHGDLNLVARQGTPLPTLLSYDYGSFNPETNEDEIIVFTNSIPVALAPARWYLGVFNANLKVDTYTIMATEYANAFPSIITLTNAEEYFNTNAVAGQTNDYYRYQVSTNAAGVLFEIHNPTADMTLVAHKGLPLPSLSSYDLISANPELSDEEIVLFTNSTPVALTPGDWFLDAANVSGGPAGYQIMAVELPVDWTNIVITNLQVSSDSFCLTWTAVPGLRYFVEGVPDLSETNWTTVSPELVATDVQTTWCEPLPSTNHFFRVELGVLLPAAVVPTIAQVSNGLLLHWQAPAESQYNVQWSSSLAPPSWKTFTNSPSARNGEFWFLDDGSESGGMTRARYYRLQPVPRSIR